MAEDKELVLPAGLEGMGVDPPDKLRLRLPAPLPSDIMPLSKTFHLTIIQVYVHIIFYTICRGREILVLYAYATQAVYS